MACTVKAAGEQDFPRETIAQHPEHILILVRLEPVKCQNDVALLCESLVEAGVVGQAQGQEFLVAGEQISDSARSDGNVQV